MPIPLAISAGLAAVQPLYKMGRGIGQKIQGKKLQKSLQRPNYTTPDQIKEATDIARMAYMDPRLRGQALMEDNIQAGTSGTIRASQDASGSSAQLLAAATAAGAQQQGAYQNLMQRGLQQQAQDEANLSRALGREARYADQEFQYNLQQPYEEKAATAGAQSEAGDQNIYGAVGDAGSLAAGIDWGALFSPKKNGGSNPTASSAVDPQKMQNAANFAARLGVNPAVAMAAQKAAGNSVPDIGAINKYIMEELYGGR